MAQTTIIEEEIVPRINDLSRNTPKEILIRDAMNAVEKIGTDPELTECIVLLSKALEKLANYNDRPLVVLSIEEVAAKYGQHINCQKLRPGGNIWDKVYMQIDSHFIKEMEQGNIKEVTE